MPASLGVREMCSSGAVLRDWMIAFGMLRRAGGEAAIASTSGHVPQPLSSGRSLGRQLGLRGFGGGGTWRLPAGLMADGRLVDRKPICAGLGPPWRCLLPLGWRQWRAKGSWGGRRRHRCLRKQGHWGWGPPWRRGGHLDTRECGRFGRQLGDYGVLARWAGLPTGSAMQLRCWLMGWPFCSGLRAPAITR